MNERKDEDHQPLSAEALKRDEWRGDDESANADEHEHEAPDEGSTRGPNPMAGTMLPPD